MTSSVPAATILPAVLQVPLEMAILVTDISGRPVSCNPAFSELLGYDRDELPTLDLQQLVHPDDLQSQRDLLGKLETGRMSTHVTETRYCARAGRTVWGRTHISKVLAESDVAQVMHLIDDMTDHKLAIEDYRQSQMLLKMAGRAAKLGGWTFLNDTQKLIWSDEICVIHDRPEGYQASLEEGMSYYLPEYQPMIASVVEGCLNHGIPFDFEAELITAAQRKIWVRAIGEAFRDARNQIIGFQGALQDISLQRKSETERNALAIKLSNTLRDMSDAFFTLDRNWHITYVNEEMTRSVRRDRDELLHRLMWEAFPGTENSRFHQCYLRALETNTVATVVEYYAPLDSWYSVRAYPTDDGVAIYFQNVTKSRKDEEQLHLLQTCVERMNDIVLITEAGTSKTNPARVVYVNEAFYKHTGYHPNEIIGKLPTELPGLDTRHGVLERISSNLRESRAARAEMLNYTKGGEELWLELDISPVKDDRGHPTHWIAIERNITERKRIADALREKNDLLRVGGRVGRIGGWTATPSDNTVRWSDEIYALLDWPKASPPSLDDFLTLLAPEARNLFRHALGEAIALGASFDHEFPIHNPSGSVKWVRIAGEPASAESGPARAVNGALQDITSMKQVEKRLREQAALLDKAQDAIWVLGLDESIEFWNLSAELIYGWSEEELQRAGTRQLLFPDAAAYESCMRQVLERGEWVGELEQTTKEGKKILVVSRWTLVRDEADKPRAVLFINTDVTERRLMEQQLLRAQRMESIGTLAGGIAHDLNNVLSPIMMSIELLKDAIPRQEDQALLQTIEVSARRGADMVKQVLSFARGIEGKRYEVRLSDVLRDLEQMLTETIPKNISISTVIAPDLWFIKADPTQLQQVLLNLCVNARDAMPNGGRIMITATNMMVDKHYAAMNLDAEVGAYLKIEVQDDGTGIAPEILERIFEPFFTTKPQGEGTGLGLATTMAIVKSHGGYIRAYSEPGRGTRFRIYLPADPSLSGEDVSNAPPAFPRGSGELIMVVDDEAAIRQVTRLTLENHGYRVVVASNGAEAVATYAQGMQNIELVIVDMMMPVMDGPATIQALRMIDPKVRVIGASGIPQNGKLDAVVNSGVSHFLPKPYTAEVMLRMIATALQE